jgi:hypothetical protein
MIKKYKKEKNLKKKLRKKKAVLFIRFLRRNREITINSNQKNTNEW